MSRMNDLLEKSNKSKTEAHMDVSMSMMMEIMSQCSLKTFDVVHCASKELEQLSYEQYVAELQRERYPLSQAFRRSQFVQVLRPMNDLLEKSNKSKTEAHMDVSMMMEIMSRCSLKIFDVVRCASKELEQLSYEQLVCNDPDCSEVELNHRLPSLNPCRNESRPSLNKFKNFRTLKPSIVSGISPENDWDSNQASTVLPNPIGILQETLVPIRVVVKTMPVPELDNIQGFGDGVVVTNDPVWSRGIEEQRSSKKRNVRVERFKHSVQ
ncbi:hypothetical protein L2E82_45474 [Cichorium intybus]|uniref:Uncharacterized protein n=1 Tax=Cichorium intybus TaxID=13427 RepID=A0ACB8ZT33_CICIN|nr:hypothetical protein L2E82_45474 [Cichorium intybus]